MTVAPTKRPRRGEGGRDAVDVLVGHRGRHQGRRARRPGTGAGHRGRWRARRRRPGCGRHPAGRRGPRSRAVPGDPATPPLAYPARRCRGRGPRDPGRVERIEQRVGDGDVGRLVATAQTDPRSPETGQLDVDPVAIPAEQLAPASTSVNGTPSRRARRRITASPSPRAPVTARSPRSMIAAFSRAIAVIVSIRAGPCDRGPRWSPRPPRHPRRVSRRACRRDPPRRARRPGAPPRSGRRRRPSGARTRSARRASARRRSETRSTRSTSRAKSSAAIGRPSTWDALAVGHEVRFGRRGRPGARPPEARRPPSARTLPLPFVPATRAPRTARCGSPSSRRSARVRPRPSRTPNRPRSPSAATRLAHRSGHRSNRASFRSWRRRHSRVSSSS